MQIHNGKNDFSVAISCQIFDALYDCSHVSQTIYILRNNCAVYTFCKQNTNALCNRNRARSVFTYATQKRRRMQDYHKNNNKIDTKIYSSRLLCCWPPVNIAFLPRVALLSFTPFRKACLATSLSDSASQPVAARLCLRLGVALACPLMCWISSRLIYNCTDYFDLVLRCLLPTLQMAGAGDRHSYQHNDTSSDTEDYNDERRRRVFKNRMRYVTPVWANKKEIIQLRPTNRNDSHITQNISSHAHISP